MALLTRISQQAGHLGMILVADDDRCKSLFGMSADDALDLDHPWAGGIDDGETGFFKLQLGLGWNAVCADQDGAVAAVGNLS